MTAGRCSFWRVRALLVLRPARAAALFNGNGGQIIGAPRPAADCAALGSSTVGAGLLPVL